MKTAERIVIVFIVLLLICAAAWMYFAVTTAVSLRDTGEAYAENAIEDALVSAESASGTVDMTGWRRYYPVTTPIQIATTTVLASVAETVPERIRGLSNTPYLPDNVVKLFVFGTEGAHSIWMKDMQYPIDIMWASRDGTLVHIVENVSPDTYPESFSSPVPAWYVIEANAGFVAEHGIDIGDIMRRVED